MATAPPPTRHATRRDWSQRAERHALSLQPDLLAQARANSRAAADPAFLMGLAHEIALTRHPELTRAYKTLVMVTAGFKKRSRAGIEVLTRSPCVVLVVRRKWTPEATDTAHAQHLPRWLVTFADRDGQRQPFALPTDVQLETGFSNARAHARSVWLAQPGFEWEHGAVALAVSLQSAQGQVACLLSAQHVFTPRPEVNSNGVQAGLAARPIDAAGQPASAPVLVTSLPYGGALRGDQDPLRPSLDLQLARIDDPAAAGSAVGARQWWPDEPWVRTPARLLALAATRWFHLLVPENNPQAPPGRPPLRSQLDALLTQPHAIQYAMRQGGNRVQRWVYHDGLIKLQVKEPPFATGGDSGSAVVILQPNDKFTLVGLYIGGDGNVAYAIPAWQLFDLDGYWSFFPAGARLTPMPL